jgi:hypothetical protein
MGESSHSGSPCGYHPRRIAEKQAARRERPAVARTMRKVFQA